MIMFSVYDTITWHIVVFPFLWVVLFLGFLIGGIILSVHFLRTEGKPKDNPQKDENKKEK